MTPPKKPDHDPLAREVERLLKKLPGADPSLRHDPDDRPPRPPGVTTGPRGAVGRSVTPRLPTPPWVWARVFAGIVLCVALTQWPYRTDCGWPVLGYLAAATLLLVVGVWATVGAWRLHLALAHVLALAVVLGAGVLLAGQILPRVGYAARARTWRCSATPPAVAPAPVAPATPPDSAEPASPPGS